MILGQKTAGLVDCTRPALKTKDWPRLLLKLLIRGRGG